MIKIHNTRTKADEFKAYHDGNMARQYGETGAACPFKNRHGVKAARLRRAWLDGWFDQDKELAL